MLAEGTWRFREAADEAIALVRYWHDIWGLSAESIADAAGLNRSTVAPYMWPENHHKDRQYVHPETLDALRNLDIDRVPGDRWISVHGTRRRLEALQLAGWSQLFVAQKLGITRQAVSQIKSRWDRVTADTARAVAALYDEYGMRQGPSLKARTWAIKGGYAPALAWDDIDDPEAKPQGIEPERSWTDIDEWLWLVQGGEDPIRAAARLGVTVAAIEQQGRRKNRPDIYKPASWAHQKERAA